MRRTHSAHAWQLAGTAAAADCPPARPYCLLVPQGSTSLSSSWSSSTAAASRLSRQVGPVQAAHANHATAHLAWHAPLLLRLCRFWPLPRRRPWLRLCRSHASVCPACTARTACLYCRSGCTATPWKVPWWRWWCPKSLSWRSTQTWPAPKPPRPCCRWGKRSGGARRGRPCVCLGVEPRMAGGWVPVWAWGKNI